MAYLNEHLVASTPQQAAKILLIAATGATTIGASPFVSLLMTSNQRARNSGLATAISDEMSSLTGYKGQTDPLEVKSDHLLLSGLDISYG